MINILDWESFNEGYNKPRDGGKSHWSVKYKKKIDCNNYAMQLHHQNLIFFSFFHF